MDRIAKVAAASIAVGVVVLALKYFAFALTGSVALYSDALESIINVVTAVTAFLAIRVSGKPADKNHPYGHHKVEYFAVIVESVCVILAAVSILREALIALLSPHAIDAPWQGLLVSSMGTAINAAWGWVLVGYGRKPRSPALVADGRHLFVDVFTSIGVILGVALVAVTGLLILDPLVAALVAVNIIWQGWRLMKESIAGLMDEAVPSDTLDRIRSVISAQADGAIEAHDVKTRNAGRVTFIEFHLVVPGDMSVAASHGICDRLERALKSEVEGAVVTIHVEPEEKAKHAGVVVV